MPASYHFHPGDAIQSNPENISSLTYKERAQLQTFPPTFRWPSNASEADIMVGNAIPVELSKQIALSITAFHNGEDCPLSFQSWLEIRKNLTVESAKDIVSHLRKVNSILKMKSTDDIDAYQENLIQIKEFENQEKTVINKETRALIYLQQYNEFNSSN